MTSRTRKPVTPDTTPWAVVIDGKRRGQLWGRYCSRAGAAATVRTLRGHGLAARIVAPGGDLLEVGAT